MAAGSEYAGLLLLRGEGGEMDEQEDSSRRARHQGDHRAEVRQVEVSDLA